MAIAGPDAPPSPELVSVLRDQAFDEIEHVANKAASYSRSIGEAAFRGDDVEVLVHLKQLKDCCVAMIRTYKEYFDGQGAERAGDRPNKRSGDGVARG